MEEESKGKEKSPGTRNLEKSVGVKEKLALGNLLDKESSCWGRGCNAIWGREIQLWELYAKKNVYKTVPMSLKHLWPLGKTASNLSMEELKTS